MDRFFRFLGILIRFQLFFNSAGSLWKQCPKISSLLLSVESSGLKRRYHFSWVHNPHTPVMGENGWALSKIFHFNSKFNPLSLISQIFLLRVVSLLCFLWLIDFLWFASLSLNFDDVNPTLCVNFWASFWVDSSCPGVGAGGRGVIVAWYLYINIQ